MTRRGPNASGSQLVSFNCQNKTLPPASTKARKRTAPAGVSIGVVTLRLSPPIITQPKPLQSALLISAINSGCPPAWRNAAKVK